jgi:superfamily II DNA or RNA helicase
LDVSVRYDAFQREAVSNIVADFREDPKGRFLLVIPTGGGKTTTAVKAVSGLYDAGLLVPADRVMWVVHRDELRRQAKDSFAAFAGIANKPELADRVDILMLSEVKQYLGANPHCRFAVIDEAHHVAAKSYQPLFDRPGLGILGLTATPSRHDGQPLQFTRESYSIGFPDLVSMGVLLRPNVIEVDGGTYDISDISNDSDALEVLNNDQRNSRILAALVANSAKIHKAILYVGTRTHARDLYQLIKSSRLADKYESIGIILGGEWRRYSSAKQSEVVDEQRSDFIAAQKASDRSILVNVDVLTEGYDDPGVNTIVMSRPTNSKLVYMQALGRAVRMDPNNEAKEAYVIEVTDNLPNIKYRIDNRWLYSDISDQLEPDVVDVFYSSPESLNMRIREIFDKFHVRSEHRNIANYSPRDRITLLLFKVYAGNGMYEHFPLLITNATRQAAAGFFNFLASRMKPLHGLDVEQVFRPVQSQTSCFPVLDKAITRKSVFQAMENAWDLAAGDSQAVTPLIASGHPWISFVSFRLDLSEEDLGANLLQFTEDMLNKQTVRKTLRTGGIGSDFMLVKFPQPLHGTWGVFLPPAEFAMLRGTVERLAVHASDVDGTNQWRSALSILGTATVPVEQRHIQSLTTIVRERLDYYRPIDSQPGRSEQ